MSRYIYIFALFTLSLVFWEAPVWKLRLFAAENLMEAPVPIMTAKPEQYEPSKKEKPEKKEWHPPHVLKVWSTKHEGSIFRVTQMPRCEHVETLFTYEPSGETITKAKTRTGGFAAMSGSFHHPKSFALADFFQREGCILSPARTGRTFLVITSDGSIDLTKNYADYKGKPGVCAMAMGQSLIPWERDGFSVSFMKQKTDRMAIALNKNFIYIVQGKSSIYTLSSFIKKNLPVDIAVNSDGGHVVRGTAPVHIVFRWKTEGIAGELLK